MIILKRILYFQVIMYPAAILFCLETMDVVRFIIRSIKANVTDLLLAIGSIFLTVITVYPGTLLYGGVLNEDVKNLRRYVKFHYLMYFLPSLLYLCKEYRYETLYPYPDNPFKPDGILPRFLWFNLAMIFLIGTQLTVHFIFQLVRQKQMQLLEMNYLKIQKYIKHGFLPWIDLKKLLYFQLILAPIYSPMGVLRLYGKLTTGDAAVKFLNDKGYLICHSGMILGTTVLWVGLPWFYQGIKYGSAKKLKYYLLVKIIGHVTAGLFFFAFSEMEENISKEHEPIILKIFTTFYTMWGATEISQLITMIHQLEVQKEIKIRNLNEMNRSHHAVTNILEMQNNDGIMNSSECVDELMDSCNFSKIPKAFRISASRLKVEMINPNCIGSGQYGRVWKGHLSIHSYPVKKTVSIAMKVIDNGFTSEGHKSSIVSEVLAMINAGTHENLVKLHGVCRDTRRWQLGIILELCEFGNLKAWLEKSPEFHEGNPKSSVGSLHKWSYEVALGMEYLSFKKIVHGDLALRNILLDGHKIAKISDFGMSIRLYNYQRYAVSSMQIFPWRWMAPEALCDLKFSTESDVFAFGVLLWEMYSLGKIPWTGLLWSSDFVRKLVSGTRLEKPEICPESIYNEIMVKCWEIRPSDRLSFGDIVDFFESFMQQNTLIT